MDGSTRARYPRSTPSRSSSAIFCTTAASVMLSSLARSSVEARAFWRSNEMSCSIRCGRKGRGAYLRVFGVSLRTWRRARTTKTRPRENQTPPSIMIPVPTRPPEQAIPRAPRFHAPTSKSERSRSEEHTSELQSLAYLVCRLLLEKKKKKTNNKFQVIKRHKRKKQETNSIRINCIIPRIKTLLHHAASNFV